MVPHVNQIQANYLRYHSWFPYKHKLDMLYTTLNPIDCLSVDNFASVCTNDSSGSHCTLIVLLCWWPGLQVSGPRTLQMSPLSLQAIKLSTFGLTLWRKECISLASRRMAGERTFPLSYAPSPLPHVCSWDYRDASLAELLKNSTSISELSLGNDGLAMHSLAVRPYQLHGHF